MWVCRVDSLKMTGGNTDPANSNAGDRRNDILELARAIREADNQKAQLPKVKVPPFDDTNASAWANKFEQLGSCCEWSSEKMLQMVKRYCMVKYKEEVSELVQASRDWPDFKAKLLDKYQLGDQQLDLADLRKVSRPKFSTAKQFLMEFERVARLVPDLPDKDRCLIFLEKFSEVEQRELMKDMTGRYDWPKIKENLLVGSFDQMLYRLLKQQKEDRNNEGVSADKDQAVYKTLTDMRNMMADMKEERLKLQEAEAEVEVEDKALGEAEEMGAAEVIGRIGFASIVAKMDMGYGFVRPLPKMNIRGEVYDFEGNLIDPNVEGGIRKEVFRHIGRDFPATFRLASPEEVEQIELDATMESLTIKDTKARNEGPTALGGVLIQKDGEGRERPLRFESRTLNEAEQKYSQFKKETLAVLHCLRIFRNYLFGRRFVLRVDPTALAQSLNNYSPSDPTIARWLIYIWMFDFEIERIAGTQNRADGLSRIEWDSSKDQAEDSVPVDGFLETDEQQLSINVWEYISNASSRPGKSIRNSLSSYQKCAELVMRESFIEEDPCGKRSAEQMMRLALSDPVRLLEEPLTIDGGHEQGDEVLRTSGGMVFLVNSLIQEDRGRLMLEEGEDSEIKEAFREEEYDGIYKKIGLWLNGDLNEAEIELEIRRKAKDFVIR
ncbi:hypothetical protein CBR_g66642 [Chara braunii]|uniref:Reverse transcriptase RNase H-like domain-containing protein n=1 Tax=Chara braunii TaxID=69332 RepID=A0A388JPU1_CHABU|nr:hypothetical protein CBR_g66642 [Chara braunii]|eukprot:GBG59839.1 hypothetical protein CBR_g66642 [Chara braunii]